MIFLPVLTISLTIQETFIENFNENYLTVIIAGWVIVVTGTT